MKEPSQNTDGLIAGMKESFQNIGDLIAEPSGTFTRLKSQPRWGVAFISFYLFSMLFLWAAEPYHLLLTAEKIAQQVERGNLTPAQIQSMNWVNQVMGRVLIVFGPLSQVLGFIVISVLLILGARWLLKNETLTFRHIYAAVVHISLIGCIGQLVNTALLLVFKDVEGIKHLVDLNMIPGLHLLSGFIVGEEVNPKLMMFFSHINPVSLWLIAVMAIAIAVLADMPKNRARIAAVILWGVSILPEVLFA